jgi:hypothetical protein
MTAIDLLRTQTAKVPRLAAHAHRRHRVARVDRLWVALTWAAILVGLALRFREYVFNRSLWLDEASVTNDIMRNGFHGLLKPLNFQQAAPVGWLWLEKLTVEVFGTSEASLRLWPFISSLALVFLTPIVARRLMSPRATAAATFLVAVSPQLIYYASEVKPYGSDALTALLIVLLLTTQQIWDSTLKAGLTGLALAFLSWYSYPALFIAAAGLLVVLAIRSRDRRPALPLILCGLILATSDVVEYVVNLRQLSNNSFLASYWQTAGGFPPAHDTWGRFMGWLGRQPVHVLGNPGHLKYTQIAVVLGLIGILVVARRPPSRRPLLIVLSLPLAGIAVAAFSKYPLAIRVALWFIPVVLLLLAGVIDLRGRYAVAMVVPLAIVTMSSVVAGLDAFPTPLQNNDARGSYAFVAAHFQPADRVLIDSWALPTWTYYAPLYHLAQDLGGIFQINPPTETGSCPASSAPLSKLGGDRVWIIFNHHGSNEPPDSAQLYLAYFEQYGHLTDSRQGYGGAGAFLLHFAAHPRTPISRPQWWVKNGCIDIHA